MAKRKTPARRSKPKRKRASNNGPTWRMWLMACVLILVFIGFLLFLQRMHPGHNKNGTTHTLSSHMAALSSRRKQPPPKFEFYTLLPSSKEKIPPAVTMNGNAGPTAPVVSLTKAPPVEQLTLLQVSSFRQYQDADNLKAKLLLQGFNANIEKLQDDNVTWYRVLVGPFASAAELTQSQQRLKTLHFDSIKATIDVAKPAPLPKVTTAAATAHAKPKS